MTAFSTPYDSTRGADRNRSLGEVIEAGLSSDGGLFLPRNMPHVDAGSLSTQSFLDLSLGIMEHWLDGSEYRETWQDILRDALSFPVPIIPLSEDVFVCELFHGPTLSFKDFGARTMARLLGDRLARTGEERVILVATSGDTGSAVADGFAGIEGIHVVLLFPGGGVSEVQERQLVVERPGVHPFRVDGSFDDCQQLVKAAFHHPAWASIPLSTANSINIGRLLPQMLYYWWAVLNLTRVLGVPGKPFVCVPSGNLGNLTAGVMAHLSGMPVGGFRAAHNANDFFVRFLSNGEEDAAATIRTLSNAMDVGAPSNFERLMALLPDSRIHDLISADSTSDDATLETMHVVHMATGYLPDPHTAVGIRSVEQGRSNGDISGPAIVMATAHPAKFPDTCIRAVGHAPEEPERLSSLLNAPKQVTDIAADIERLADEVRRKTGF
jgi:threonine synthase